MMFEPATKQIPAGTAGGALACWDNIRGLTQDGQDASKSVGGWDRITAVTTALYVTGAFPVDAAAEYARSADDENATAVGDLGLAAHCLTNLHDGNRLFEAKGLGAEPCEQLKQFAQTAIDRL